MTTDNNEATPNPVTPDEVTAAQGETYKVYLASGWFSPAAAEELTHLEVWHRRVEDAVSTVLRQLLLLST